MIRVSNANLSQSDFDDINLSETRFNNVNLRDSGFTNIDMSNVLFEDICFAGAQIRASNLAGMTIDGILVSDLLAAYAASKA